ncbi:MAG TPA: DNA translocase FtsK 4TM domain-containing protein [Longimicrobiales bacterium]
MLNEKKRRELLGLSLLALSVFTLLSLIPLDIIPGREVFASGNIMGVLGRWFATAAYGVLGIGALSIPLIFALSGSACFDWLRRETATHWSALLVGLALLAPAIAALFTRGIGPELVDQAVAGWIGVTLATPMVALLGHVGGSIALGFLTVAVFVATIGWNPVAAAYARLQARRKARPQADTVTVDEVYDFDIDEEVEELTPVFVNAPAPPLVAPPAAVPVRKQKKLDRKAPVLEEFGDPRSEDLPPITLLTEEPVRDVRESNAEFDRLGNVLVQTLRTFKVETEVVGRTTGPVVTQYELVPAPGVKVNRIAGLDADLALALRAPSVRIVAPIPGKGAVGVEVPNPESSAVYLRSILGDATFQRARGVLPLALGKDLTGKPYVGDLARMPHLLIAGATGSGKSVCINTLITSLIYKHPPSELRMLMIDPKMVELSMYANLPHLRHPVVTDPHDAATVLKWAVLEMERRYMLLSENGARSLAEFNRRALDDQPLRRVEPVGPESDPDRYVYTDGPLPYIVVVVDELADLMMTVQAEIEKPLAQLAQKARAIGIHLIVATQRPSVNVITGLIKANFPCRIAFRVASKVDSRTILDQNGADALLGNGDMLFLPPGSSDPVRIQGAYISTEDTERLMQWYEDRAKARPLAEEDILEYVRAREAREAEGDGMSEFFGERDTLFRQAAEICIQHNQGSTSLLQRRLRIGYGRAARIIDQLHQAGVLGPPDGSKPREVLLGLESLNAVCGDE